MSENDLAKIMTKFEDTESSEMKCGTGGKTGALTSVEDVATAFIGRVKW